MGHERCYSRRSRVHVGKDKICGKSMFVVRYGVEDSFADKRKCTLGADEKKPKDLKWGIGVEERLHVIAGCILDTELASQFFHQLRISFDLTLDLNQAFSKCWRGCRELFFR